MFAFGLAKGIYDVFLEDISESAVAGILGGIMLWSLGLLADMISKLALQPQVRSGQDSRAT
jgi:hypothetical protein